MSKRYVICGILAVLLAGAGFIAYVKPAGSPVRVPRLVQRIDIRSIHSKASEATPTFNTEDPGTPSSRPIGAPADQASGNQAQMASSIPVPTVEGGEYLERLGRQVVLTGAEREQLESIFHDVADMQRRVDRKPDPERRAQLQYKLVQQLIVRLRLVLGEVRAKTAAGELGPGNPRFEFNGSTPT